VIAAQWLYDNWITNPPRAPDRFIGGTKWALNRYRQICCTKDAVGLPFIACQNGGTARSAAGDCAVDKLLVLAFAEQKQARLI
jgi:hypothetical protein